MYKKVYFRGIIEFSNLCEKDCYYCGIRKSNRNVERFCMSKKEIIECLEFIKKANYGSVVLQSGEIHSEKFKKFLLDIIKYIHKNYPEMGVTISCGEFDYNYLKDLKKAGADRYLLRIETSSKKLYGKLHPMKEVDFSPTLRSGLEMTDERSLKMTDIWDKRFGCLKNLQKLGYQVGTGIMVGIPGQTDNDLKNDLKFFKENDFDMYGIGPYVIHKDTPLAHAKTIRWWSKNKIKIFKKTLRFIKEMRKTLKDVNIAAGTALDVFHPLGRIMALKAGANVIMPSVTPKKYREKYLLYENKPCVDEDAEKCFKCIINKVESAGFVPVLGQRGDSEHFTKKVLK